MNNYEIPYEKPKQPDLPSDGVLADIFDDRLKTLESILSDIAGEIKSRKCLGTIMLDTVDYHICVLRSRLRELETSEFKPVWKKIEQNISELESEKRMHKTRTWQDIAALKKEFRVAFKEYRDILRRFKIIKG